MAKSKPPLGNPSKVNVKLSYNDLDFKDPENKKKIYAIEEAFRKAFPIGQASLYTDLEGTAPEFKLGEEDTCYLMAYVYYLRQLNSEYERSLFQITTYLSGLSADVLQQLTPFKAIGNKARYVALKYLEYTQKKAVFLRKQKGTIQEMDSGALLDSEKLVKENKQDGGMFDIDGYDFDDELDFSDDDDSEYDDADYDDDSDDDFEN